MVFVPVAKSDLRDFALSCKDVLKPFGKTETLLFYGAIAPFLKGYLKGKLLAAKNWVPKSPMPFLIKRGSREPHLSISELSDAVTIDFMDVRKEVEHLGAAKGKITPVQAKVWNYFLPRKLSDFFYATNGESAGGQIDRVFFDLDRGQKISTSEAQEACRVFVEIVSDDLDFWASAAGRAIDKPKWPFVAWTGNSFHAMLFFKTQVPAKVYDKFFQYSKNSPLANFTGRWAAAVAKETRIPVIGGHEKKENELNVDPSQTPSGKLCRVPLGSLHMKSALVVDGVSMPVDARRLGEKNFAAGLQAFTPKKLLEELPGISRLLPF